MHTLTGEQAARLLGISRRTLYRYVEKGRVPVVWSEATLAPLIGTIERLPCGPARNPQSVRYTTGRHRFTEQRGKR